MDYIEIAKTTGTWLGIIIQIIGFLVALFLLWKSNKKDFKHLNQTICNFKFNIEKELTRHETEINNIYDKIDDHIIPAISDLQANMKKNCQAVKDMKDNCRNTHYGVVHDFVR
jgi:peptidoglycan hydrolase CwlO-like protein